MGKSCFNPKKVFEISPIKSYVFECFHATYRLTENFTLEEKLDDSENL